MNLIDELRNENIFSPRVLEAIDQPLLYNNASIEKFKKGQIFIRQNEKPDNIYILMSGIIRGFLTKPNGQDITDSIIFSKGMIVRPISKVADISLMNYQALIESYMLVIPAEIAVQLVESDIEIMRQSLYSSNIHLRNHRELKIANLSFSAKERYKWFCAKYPYLIGRIPNRVIASFIGMTPETLSRIQHSTDD